MTTLNPDKGLLAGARLDHVGIMVPELDEGVRWYTETLGFSVKDRWANEEAGMEWAHLALGDLVIELVKRPGLTDADGAAFGYHHLAITVDDCEATVAALAERGVTVMFAPSYFDRHDMTWAFVQDYLGNVIEILSYASEAQ